RRNASENLRIENNRSTAMPLSAAEARTRINEGVMVEMPVKAAKNCQRCSLMYLDSEADHHDPKNFAVVRDWRRQGKWGSTMALATVPASGYSCGTWRACSACP